MTMVEIPNLVNEMARAGAEGLPWRDGISDRELVRLCRQYGLGLDVVDGRVRIQSNQDYLVPAWIEAETPAIAWDHLRVSGFFEIGSTNEEALARARSGAPHGSLVVAETQTAGRGRKGRKWISAPREGLYFSILVHPTQPIRCWPILTHVASAAVAKTLHDLHATGMIPRPLTVDVKWPNDVLISGKKVAGILLETTPVDSQAHAAIIGIGINVGKGSLPAEIREGATAIASESGACIPRRRLLVLLLSNLQQSYVLFERGEHDRILDQWKEYSSMWNGVPVWINDEGDRYQAITCGLSAMGALRVKTNDGAIKTLIAGDVSIRCI